MKNNKNFKDESFEVPHDCPIKIYCDYVMMLMKPRKVDSSIIIPEGLSMGDRSAVIVAVGNEAPPEYLHKHVIFAQFRPKQDWTNPKTGDEYIIMNWKDIVGEFIDEEVSGMYSRQERPDPRKISPARINAPQIQIPGGGNG